MTKGACYMIGAVSQLLGLHPQTIRQYERLGLITPIRTNGNTRLYSDNDLDRLRFIISLTRDMGINLAGVEMIVNMKDQIVKLEETINIFSRKINERLGESMNQNQNLSGIVVVKVKKER
jgi:MerR family transcriptional regulator/heat shock protein HspR